MGVIYGAEWGYLGPYYHATMPCQGTTVLCKNAATLWIRTGSDGFVKVCTACMDVWVKNQLECAVMNSWR